MLQANLHIDPHFTVADVDNRLFSSFIEHLGRAVYDGIYCPEHPSANAAGFRQDLLELIRPLNIPLIRYPGGNFVSGYRWEDGVGPKEQRPVRLDRAWCTLETNQVGVQEFAGWCREIGADIMMAVNLGTRGVDDACNLLEYCNHPSGTLYSNLRISHGAVQPYNIKTWCLGNEMDGPWQVGHKTAEEYGRLAMETARAMRKIDDSIQLVASGSSYPEMPTFPQWEATVLDHVYEDVDYLSIHQYLGDTTQDLKDFLAKSLTTESFIQNVLATCDYVRARKRSHKQMMLSFDEWNLWYHSVGSDEAYRKATPWQYAPSLVEDIYTMADAAVFGTMLITILRHADRIKIACLAQLVNVIAPIMTQPKGGQAWIQSIYWPFLHASLYGRGTVLHTAADSPRYDSKTFTDVPYLESVSIYNQEKGEVTIFAVNRSTDSELVLSTTLEGFSQVNLIEHITLNHPDLQIVNGPGADNIRPRKVSGAVVEGKTVTAALPPVSWNVLRLSVGEK